MKASRLFPVISLMTSSMIMVGNASASAATPATCTGGNLSGTYRSSLTVTGLCYLVKGTSIVVDGGLTVASGAMLDGISPGGTELLGSALPGNLTVKGSVEVKTGGALLLGWCIEPNNGTDTENCDKNKLSYAHDRVRGNITAVDALSVIVHNVRVSGRIRVTGGGGGVQCTTPALFSEDTDPAVNGTQSIGYDFSPVNYSDLESNTVGGSVSVTNLDSCWFGALRDSVRGDFTFNNNTMSDPDGDEVVGNTIHHNMSCTGNSPEVQFGDSGSGPNIVSGTATGECASPISVKS